MIDDEIMLKHKRIEVIKLIIMRAAARMNGVGASRFSCSSLGRTALSSAFLSFVVMMLLLYLLAVVKSRYTSRNWRWLAVLKIVLLRKLELWSSHALDEAAYEF